MSIHPFRIMLGLFTVSLSFALSGCATITRGTKQDVSVSSNPSGAKVYIDDVPVDVTPCIVQLPRNQNARLRLELPGYERYEMLLTSNLSVGWSIGSFVLGQGVSLIIDVIAGGIYTIEPERVDAQLISNSASSATSKNGTLRITVTMQKPGKDWVKIGQMKRVTAN